MLAASAHVPAWGSYISAEACGAYMSSLPPITMTRPSLSTTVGISSRRLFIPAAADQAPVAGSQISAVFTANLSRPLPPATSTLPSGSSAGRHRAALVVHEAGHGPVARDRIVDLHRVVDHLVHVGAAAPAADREYPAVAQLDQRVEDSGRFRVAVLVTPAGESAGALDSFETEPSGSVSAPPQARTSTAASRAKPATGNDRLA